MNILPLAALAVAAAVVFGRRPKKRSNAGQLPPVDQDELERGDLDVADAIQQALAEMQPGDTVDDATNRAYWLAYPDCPEVLDPNDPSQADCIDLWVELRKAIDIAVSEGARIPDGSCDPLDPSTWPEGTICVDTSGGWRALPKDEASGCKNAIFADDRNKVWACLSDGTIEDVIDIADRGPFAVSLVMDDVLYVAEAADLPEGHDDLIITLRAPNPYGKAGIRALYLALSAKDAHPELYVKVALEPGDSPQGVPKYQVERWINNSWVDEIWLPVDEGWDMNEADVLGFAEEKY